MISSNATLLFVIPAEAGTQTEWFRLVRKLSCREVLRGLGPRLRGDDRAGAPK
jgi:hypothetical protein